MSVEHIIRKALENAMDFEAKKDGLQQRQNGDWTVRITVQAADMYQAIINAPMGTVFQCVFVEIDQKNEPVDHKAMERDKWRALGPTKQAGIRCSDPVFWAWLSEEKGHDVNSHEDAAVVVRTHCNVTSRSDLNKPGFQQARTLWYDLDQEFQAWKARESHG